MRRASAALCSALLGGCLARDSEPPRDTYLGRCTGCHDTGALAAPQTDESRGPREWLLRAGSGLTVAVALLPAARQRFDLLWPRRGRHAEAGDSECRACHPVQESGERHGARRYPERGESRCDECHAWVRTEVVTQGASSVVYTGTMRPRRLLEAGTDAHARLFREGYAPAALHPDLSVSRLPSGCLSCHALSSEEHGEIPGCLSCHDFGLADDASSPHARHLRIIEERRAVNDPAHAAAAPCAYCHGFATTADDLHRPACYNCHLSGHRPTAVFWP
jgi:hypothetical protein